MHTSHVTDYCCPVIYGRRRRHPVLNLTLLPDPPHMWSWCLGKDRKREEGVAGLHVQWDLFWLVWHKVGCPCWKKEMICSVNKEYLFWWTSSHSELTNFHARDPAQEVNITVVKPKVQTSAHTPSYHGLMTVLMLLWLRSHHTVPRVYVSFLA